MFTLPALFNLLHPGLEYLCHYFIWKVSELFRAALFFGVLWHGRYEFSAWILSFIFVKRYVVWYRRVRMGLALFGGIKATIEDATKSVHGQHQEMFPDLPPAIHPYIDTSLGFVFAGLGVALSQPLAEMLFRLHRFIPELLMEAASLYYQSLPDEVHAFWTINDMLMAWLTQWILNPARERLITRRLKHSKHYMLRGKVSPAYQYKALSSNTAIRLLKIQAQSNSSGQTKCELMETDLSSESKYIAVSYCWSNQEATDSLRIDSDPSAHIYITRNASDALRSMTPLSGAIYVWMDSICINQEDEAEKDQQITIMNRIFRNASEVVAHLSEATPNSVDLISFLNRMCWHYAQEDRKAFERALTEEPSDQDVYLHKPPMLEETRFWIAWKEFVAHEYWSRIWVIQECAAARRITVVYGNKPLAWEILQLSNLLAKSTSMQAHNQIVRSANEGMDYIHRIIKRRAIYQDSQSSEDIFVVAIDHSYSRATKAEDKINALLNLSHDHQEPSIQPNYCRSPREVYMAIAELALQRQTFRLFGFSGLFNQSLDLGIQNLPSWVPDFSAANSVNVDTTRYYDRGYKAGGKENIEYHTDPLRGELRIKGILFDTMAQVATPIDFKNEHDRIRGIKLTSDGGSQWRIDERIKEYLSLFESRIASRHDPKDRIRLRESFWRTVTDDFNSQVLSGEELAAAIKALEQWETTLWIDKDNSSNLNVSLSELYVRVSSETFARDFWPSHTSFGAFSMVLDAFLVGVFGITEKGYMALAPPGTRVGDEVAVFQGSSVPQIVRRCEARSTDFRFWGEAYVAGIMYGEAMQLPRKWFVLR